MSYGTGPFGTFAFALPYLAPAAAVRQRGLLVSSRQFDPTTAQFIQNGDGAGSFAGMPDVRQRVVLLCATVRAPDKQTANFASEMSARIRAALSPLMAKPAVIKLLGVDVTPGDRGARTVVRYRDLTNGRASEVEL